jgi:glutaredoxin
MILKVYTKPSCIYCEEVKAHLTKLQIAFSEVNITADLSSKAFLVSQGHKSVPVAYRFNDSSRPELIGGHKEIMGLSHA